MLVSAYLYRGLPRDALDLARRGEADLLLSEEMVEALARVLAYPKFGLSTQEVAQVLNDLRGFATYLEVRDTAQVIEEDPTDNAILALARAGAASFIVSGDRHLLKLSAFEGIPILSVREFLEQFRKTW